MSVTSCLDSGVSSRLISLRLLIHSLQPECTFQTSLPGDSSVVAPSPEGGAQPWHQAVPVSAPSPGLGCLPPPIASSEKPSCTPTAGGVLPLAPRAPTSASLPGAFPRPQESGGDRLSPCSPLELTSWGEPGSGGPGTAWAYQPSPARVNAGCPGCRLSSSCPGAQSGGSGPPLPSHPSRQRPALFPCPSCPARLFPGAVLLHQVPSCKPVSFWVTQAEPHVCAQPGFIPLRMPRFP